MNAKMAVDTIMTLWKACRRAIDVGKDARVSFDSIAQRLITGLFVFVFNINS